MAIEYWRGYMNWPLDPQWKCEVCGGLSLMWGLVHAQCRCTTCHTHYRMRDENGEEVTTPIWMIRPEYAQVVKEMYKEKPMPIEMMDIQEMHRRIDAREKAEMASGD